MSINYLDSVDDYEIENSEVLLDVNCMRYHGLDADSEEVSNSSNFYIDFLSDNIVHFKLLPDGVDIGSESKLDLNDIDEDVSLDSHTSKDSVVLDTEDVRVEIDLDEFGFSVSDGDKSVGSVNRWRNIHGRKNCLPMGYTEELSNQTVFTTEETHFSMQFDSESSFFGTGESATALDKTGEKVTCEVRQPSGTRSEHMHKSVPFYMSDSGFGVFVDTHSSVDFDFGSKSSGIVEASTGDTVLLFYIINGDSMKDVLERFTELTGRPELPPRWSFGIWYSRNTYESAEEVREISNEMESRDVPCDVMHLDPGWMTSGSNEIEWSDGFSDRGELFKTLRSQGRHISLWQRPSLITGEDYFEEAMDKGYLLQDGRGRTHIHRVKGGKSGIIDFSNEDALEWWAEKTANKLEEEPVDVIKADFGEYTPYRTVNSDSLTGRFNRNLYPLKYQESVKRAFEMVGKEPVLWARSGWATGQRNPIHWGGDPTCDFKGMRDSLRLGLNISMSGYQYWSCDAAGYKHNPSDKLYRHWALWSILGLSHIRFHGKSEREPWNYGDETLELVRRASYERYRLLPYLYAEAKKASDTGVPVMRPLALEFENDKTTHTIDSQAMVGSEIMICPIFEDTSRDVYLPEGQRWVQYDSGEVFSGGQNISVQSDSGMPIMFVKYGSVIPRYKFDSKVNSLEDTVESVDDLPSVELLVYGIKGDDYSFEYFDDLLDNVLKTSISGAENSVISEVLEEVVYIDRIHETVDL